MQEGQIVIEGCRHSKIKVTEGYAFDHTGDWVPHVILVCRICHRGIAQYKKPKEGVPSLDELALKLVYCFNWDPDRDKFDYESLHELR